VPPGLCAGPGRTFLTRNLLKEISMNRSMKMNALAAAFAATLAACGGGGDANAPAAGAPPTSQDPGNNPPPPPPAGFSLTLSTDKAVVMQGGDVTVKATVTRDAGFDGAVQVALSGLPGGASAQTVTIPAGATEADIVIHAQGTAPHSLPTDVTAQGTSGDKSASKHLSVTVRGPAGAMDTSFAGGVVTTQVAAGEDYARAAAVQPDGKIVVAGASTDNTGTWVSLVRYERDGSLDTGFGNGGKLITPVGAEGNDDGAAVVVQADGKIVVAGSSESQATGHDFLLVRYNPNGSLDTSFGNGGKVVTDFNGETDRAWALLIQDDGKILAAGETNTGPASGVDFALARYNADGTLDAGFGTAGKVVTPVKSSTGTDIVRALALQTVNGDKRILAVGGEGDFLAVRYSLAGALDTSFGTEGKIAGLFNAVIGSAHAVVVLPDTGEAVLAGQIDNHFAAVQLTPAGQLDTRFGPAGDGRFEKALTTNWNSATALVRQQDGKLILGGWAYPGPGTSGDFAAVRLLPNGTLDTGFAEGGVALRPTAAAGKSDNGRALVLQADERVPTVRAIQAGEANGSNNDYAVIRYWL
jgi:uncharacterized delta-60 repeat protein